MPSVKSEVEDWLIDIHTFLPLICWCVVLHTAEVSKLDSTELCVHVCVRVRVHVRACVCACACVRVCLCEIEHWPWLELTSSEVGVPVCRTPTLLVDHFLAAKGLKLPSTLRTSFHLASFVMSPMHTLYG